MKWVEIKLEKARQDLINILPEDLRDDFSKESYIAGGAIYSIWNNKPVKDYDFFVRSEELVEKIRNHTEFMRVWQGEKGSVKIGTYLGYTLIITDNAISIGDYQIITRWVGTPKEVIEEFDFKHNMYYYENNKIHSLVGWKYIKDNKLIYNEKRARDICGTIIRVKRFVEKGFTITNSEMAKMLLKLNEVGFNERELEILNSFDDRRIAFGS